MQINSPTDKTMKEAAAASAETRVDPTLPVTTELPDNLIAAVARTMTGTKIGFWTDTADLKKGLMALNETLQFAQEVGNLEELLDVPEAKWSRKWTELEKILDQLIETVAELESAIETSQIGNLTDATSVWGKFQNEDNALGEILAEIRSMVCEMSPKAKTKWNFWAKKLEEELLFIYNCAQSLRLKLSFLKKHSGEKVDQFHVFPKRQDPSLDDDGNSNGAEEPYDHQYRKASLELGREKHEFLGLYDAVTRFFEYYESPPERVRSNRSLEVD